MGCGPSSANAAREPAAGGGGMVTRQPPRELGNPNNRRLRPIQAQASWTFPEPMSQTSISNKRQTFWETAPQAGGRRVVWDNLRLVSETVLAGDVDLANSLLSAADLRVPHYDLSLVYDSLGNRYELPAFVYSNPTNLISDEEAVVLAGKQAAEAGKGVEHKGPVKELPLVIRIGPSGSPGSPTGGNSEQDVKLPLRTDTRVSALKLALHEKLFTGELDQVASNEVRKPNRWVGKGLPPARQRVMYRGRELKDGQHMQECGVEAESVLQIFVRPE